MRVGAVIVVKDDIGLLRRNLAYHASIGVDHFVICDRGSSPENQVALHDLERDPNVRVVDQSVSHLGKLDDQSLSGRRTMGLTSMWDTFEPDWVFVGDTDEFWVTVSGDIRCAVASSGHEHLIVERFNAAVAVGESGALLDRLMTASSVRRQEVIVKRKKLSPTELGRSKEPFVTHKIGPKFITSMRDITDIAPGFHSVRSSRPFDLITARDMLVLHIPFTTFDRFATKVANTRQHIEDFGHLMRKNQGWQQRYWASLSNEEILRKEFDRQFFIENTLNQMRSDGVVQTIEDWFTANGECVTSRLDDIA